MRIPHPAVLAPSVAALLLIGSPASAQTVLYESGFESPTFAVGQALTGQDGWVASFNENPNAATITTEAAHGGTQSAKLDGAVTLEAVSANLDALSQSQSPTGIKSALLA